MRHVSKEALLAGAAIIRKGDEPDPVSIVTKALDDLSKTVEDRLKALESKGVGKDDPEFKALADRLAEIEKKANRPAGVKPEDEQKAIETKALTSFVRTGSDVEIKAATSGNNPEGGYFALVKT